ncbi:MAG: ATP synthase F1 subunit gamma [Bacteroidaceae bacterium]|nr:ATP synthase F1 subunit gamma [Bacteroidaceae bacterium]
MNLKEVKQRIQSVKTTQKITSAMKLVSAAKLRRAQSAIEGMRPYQQKLNNILSTFLCGTSEISTPYTADREVKRVAIIIVSSSTSLCGSYNANIIRAAKELIEEYRSADIEIELFPVGKKIFEAITKMGLPFNDALMEQAAVVSYSAVSVVASELMRRFEACELDKIEILYTRFLSAAKQLPVKELFLPIDIENITKDSLFPSCEYIVEPCKKDFIEQLLPRVVTLRLFTALLDSVAAEHAARMMAMQIATDNAEELIGDLVLEYNKGRQQAITNELLDIVSGSMNE